MLSDQIRALFIQKYAIAVCASPDQKPRAFMRACFETGKSDAAHILAFNELVEFSQWATNYYQSVETLVILCTPFLAAHKQPIWLPSDLLRKLQEFVIQ
jgi:hypothetical protein